jgi:methanogenic corrinoid protein MtbC1
MPDLPDTKPSGRKAASAGRSRLPAADAAGLAKGPRGRGAERPNGALEPLAVGLALRTPPGGDIDPGKLTQLLEAEIIPRLLMAHTKAITVKPLKRPAAPSRFDARAVDEFAQLILTQDMPIVFDHVETLIDRGVAVEEVFLGLLAPTARRLGEYWTSDYCSFFDVTVGLGRLQQVLLALRLDGSAVENRPEPARTALFATLEGEGHGFGLLMVDEMFRRSGWRTVTRIGASSGEIAAIAKSASFEVIGLGASCEAGLAQLSGVIKRVRESSLNRCVRVMVGGQIFLNRPELGGVLGADLVASCAQDALAKAEKTIGHQGGRV